MLACSVNIAYGTSNSNRNHINAIKTHVFKFYLDPLLVTDLDFVKESLVKYIQDINFVLAKNTNRQLSFDPETGVVITDKKPHDGKGNNLPSQGYEVWAHVTFSDHSYSYGGYVSFNANGEAVLAGLNWEKVYNPDQLEENSDEMRDYWIQIDHMLHEFAHIFGAGMSEYYSLATVDDTTGVEPMLNIRLSDSNDTYWKYKDDYFTDPLLHNIYGNTNLGSPTDRTALLQTIQFSSLTAAIISGDYRYPSLTPPFPDIKKIIMRVLEKDTLSPIPDARVMIWKIKSVPPYEVELLVNSLTNKSGELVFSWEGSPQNNYNNLRLIKVYKDGYNVGARYVSKFDAEGKAILDNQTKFSVDIFLDSKK